MQKTSEVYKKLYHYTTWDGLQGIIESQTLWATNYMFLNDYSELILFKDRLVSLIYPHALVGFERLLKDRPNLTKDINNRGGLNMMLKH